MGAAAWRMETHSQDLMNVFPSSQLVLLSPDAPEPLMAVDNSKVYVVGGIVDKTVQKGITFSFAQQQGLPVYRLPIREYAQQLGLDFPGASTRPVLSAADVVTALVEYQQMQDWAAALKVAVPQRKRRQHGSLAARQM